jgi:tungstate transport system permease protein
MGTLSEALARAIGLLFNPTPELIEIIIRTFHVSGGALILATALGLPLGAVVALRRFPLRGVLISILNALMGLPPVVAGLFIYILLSRSGPLGFMGLLYSPSAMVIAQLVLALPIIAALTHSAVMAVPRESTLAATTLGANPTRVTLTVLFEARYGITSAVLAAFGRVMAEVGAILVVGGNIAGYTRVITTTIALETDKGDFSLALALGILLLGISFVINLALHAVQRRGRHAS